MALYPVQPGIQPLGLFDVLDTELATIKGGEVMTLGSAATTNSETETAAPDVLDGYTFGRPPAVQSLRRLRSQRTLSLLSPMRALAPTTSPCSAR